MAIAEYKSDKEFSKNCVKIANAIKRKYNLRFPSWFKSLYCKKCYNLLLPGLGAKIRIVGKGRNLKIITTCLDCKRVIRKEITRDKI
jgi:RNase P subunit RPR2